MFSYFEGGTTTSSPKKTIDFDELIQLITNNPSTSLINWIRELRKQNNPEDGVLKQKLSFITPNCTVEESKLDGDSFSKNFNQFSGYIYIDIDDVPDISKYKEYFIKKYEHLVSMVCLSCSLGGISVLFKVSNAITKENFSIIRSTIINTHLLDEQKYINTQWSDIEGIWFITSDPEIYVNKDIEITIDIPEKSINPNIEKGIKQPISKFDYSVELKELIINNLILDKENNNILKELTINNLIPVKKYNNILNDTRPYIPYKEVMNHIKLATYVNVDNPIVDLKPVNTVSFTFPPVIKDEKKQKIYAGLIHTLVFLNPELPLNYLYSYLRFFNNRFAESPMDLDNLSKLFKYVLGTIYNSPNYQFKNEKVKYIHFNKTSGLTGDEKRRISPVINGKRKRNNTIEKIAAAKQYFEEKGVKYNLKDIAVHSGVSYPTVKRRHKEESTDMEKLIADINTHIPTGTNQIDFKNQFTLSDIIYSKLDYIHPDCPQWVLNYVRTGTFG